ncbi:hypothetical protein CVT24_004695 [Panaeolus cyanescens]|uniref:Uncharacterized protein n=1 Tax=Panaeolus cyanescens TaxID=181874 RepID=A0A409YST1_9AGAR|nr:hypothetical protein CVT24_004695 [Panaeolus cyanescens]
MASVLEETWEEYQDYDECIEFDGDKVTVPRPGADLGKGNRYGAPYYGAGVKLRQDEWWELIDPTLDERQKELSRFMAYVNYQFHLKGIPYLTMNALIHNFGRFVTIYFISNGPTKTDSDLQNFVKRRDDYVNYLCRGLARNDEDRAKFRANFKWHKLT